MVRTTRPNQKRGFIPCKETFTRINFMYQAAHLALHENPHNTGLIRFYCHSVKSMAKKQVLRLHPEIKRNICKKCSMLLVPGVTAMVRKKGKKQQHLVITCLECRTPRRFPVHTDYQLWGDRAEAWLPIPSETSNSETTPLPSASKSETAPLPFASDSSQETPPSNKVTNCKHKRCRRRTVCRKEECRKINDVTSGQDASTKIESSTVAKFCDRTKESNVSLDESEESTAFKSETTSLALDKTAEKCASPCPGNNNLKNGHEVSKGMDLDSKKKCQNGHLKAGKMAENISVLSADADGECLKHCLEEKSHDLSTSNDGLSSVKRRCSESEDTSRKQAKLDQMCHEKIS